TIDGKPIYVTVNILDNPVRIQVWYINVGRSKLLLLDPNIEENPPQFRSITDYLYDARKDIRIMQEIVLGFGGVRVLEKIQVKPDVFHINEGHSAFLIIERLRKLINEENYSFDEAYAVVKNTMVFTTHTPVEAGNENFSVEMIKKYLEKEIEELGISFDAFVKFGMHNDTSTFWLPAFAMRFSRYINGVSQIHSQVSRNMWQGLFPSSRVEEIPITGITNGVHYSWLSGEMRYLFETYLGPDYMYVPHQNNMLSRILDIPDEEIWEAHMKRKRRMITFLRRKVEEDYIKKGYSMVKIKKAREMLGVNYLTVCYAKRFASYKRPFLLIRDRERLKNILTNAKMPTQLIFAGKAHPADVEGKDMIKQILEYAREYGLEDRVIFIENYDKGIAEHLVQGTDVWINTPIKPQEASGTSGMKAGMNGVLNLSILDGWWPECYHQNNGWAITAGDFYTNPVMRDIAESNQIYDLLEEEITRAYYERDEREIPRRWVNMMRESMYSVFKDFNINRMIGDYAEKFYLPGMNMQEKLLENNKSLLKQSIHRAQKVKEIWDKVYIENVKTDADKKELLFSGDNVSIQCSVYLDDAEPEYVDVELFYFRKKENIFETVGLEFVEKHQDKTARYQGNITLKSSGIQDLNVRLVPSDKNVRALYPELIKWKE
ncbi:MAG: alpha-glucan family phosphorylase, partial [Spirochaetota bacterium]